MGKVNYHEYLKLDSLLSSHDPISIQKNTPSHDEHLFITIHHSYEIWFQQILFELENVLEHFEKPLLADESTGLLIHRLERIHLILKNLITQVDILETMTPLDFLDFRNHLYPASGFQSFQFRLLENRLGLPVNQRFSYNDSDYKSQLLSSHIDKIKKAEEEPNLFTLMESWLERTPFLNHKDFTFWDEYEKSVRGLFEREKQELSDNKFLSELDKQKMLEQIIASEDSFKKLLDPEEYNKGDSAWRLSHTALRAALLIQLYRDLPVFQMPFRILTLVQEIDHDLTQWRYRHALMAQRMLGKRVGTGGSSGSKYLKKTASEHQIFKDFVQLTTFLIPRSELPEIPNSVKKECKERLWLLL